MMLEEQNQVDVPAQLGYLMQAERDSQFSRYNDDLLDELETGDSSHLGRWLQVRAARIDGPTQKVRLFAKLWWAIVRDRFERIAVGTPNFNHASAYSRPTSFRGLSSIRDSI